MTYETRITKLTIAPKGEPLFSPHVTHVEITDEAGGEYLKITQQTETMEEGAILITDEDWPVIKAAIERLLPDCRDNQ